MRFEIVLSSLAGLLQRGWSVIGRGMGWGLTREW